MASDVRWEGFTHQELYAMAMGGAGPQAGFSVAQQLRACTAELLAVDADLKAALDTLGTAWTGPAASAAGAGFTPLGRWVADADVALSNAAYAHEDQGRAVDFVRTHIPVPPPSRTKAGPFLDDQAADEAADHQVKLRAIEVMQTYSDGLPGRRDMLMSTGQPPLVTVAGAPTGGGSGGAGVGSGWSPGSPIAPSAAGFAPSVAGGGGAPVTPGAAAPLSAGPVDPGAVGLPGTARGGPGATGAPLGGPVGPFGGSSTTGTAGLHPSTSVPSRGERTVPGLAAAGDRTPGPGSSGSGPSVWGPPGRGSSGSGAAGRGPASYGADPYVWGGGSTSGGSALPGSGRWGGGATGGSVGVPDGGRAGGSGSGMPADPGRGGRAPAGMEPVGRSAAEAPAARTGRGTGQMFPPMIGAGAGSGGPTTRQRPGYLIDDHGVFCVDHLAHTAPVIGED